MSHIVDIRTHVVHALWRNWIFVEVETDDGFVGLGEATTEGRELTILGHIDDLRRYFDGADAAAIELHRRNLVRDPFWVGGFVAQTGLAAIEVALWDILGQRLGVPVWQLLGGKIRDRVRVYANGWYFGAVTPEDWAERASEVVELGYTALKFDPFGRSGPDITTPELRDAAELVAAVRGAVGSDVDLMIEMHGRFDVQAALRVGRELERFGCYWLEEPVPPGNTPSLSQVAAGVSTPLAAGERCHSATEFVELVRSGSLAICQPDIVHTGGIGEMRRIASLCEASNLSVAPHNPNGAVATVATLMIDAVIPNFLVQEMLEPWDAPWRHIVVQGCPRVADGYLAIPNEPGLGLRLDLDAIADHPFQPVEPSFYSSASVLEAVELRPGR
jgi:galactonate dehydratase